MLWFKKQKVHVPFGNDFNLVSVNLVDGERPTDIMSYTFPDNCICQLISVTVHLKAGFLDINCIWVQVVRRGRHVWDLPYSRIIRSAREYYVCWGVGLHASTPSISDSVLCTPLPEHCFIEGGDQLSLPWWPQDNADTVDTATLYFKQWIIY